MDKDCQGLSFGDCQQTNEKFASSFRLLFIFLKAITGFSKNITPNLEKAAEYLEKSVKINNELGGYHIALWSKVHLNLLYKNLGKTYLKQDIIQLIKGAQDTEYLINFPLYQLLEDTSYLETAYNEVQEKADAMEEELKLKFLSYPIPKAIVEEWEKVK